MTFLCIIGGTGFIGKSFCRKLEGESRFMARILTRHTQLSNKWPENTESFIGDLLDIESLKNFIQLNSIVINLSYLNDKSDEDNIQTAKNIARVCLEKCVNRLVHCSSAAVVGQAREPIIDEETICYPLTSYEKTKHEIENILIERLRGKTEVLILRPTAVFGENGKNLVKLANELTSCSRFKLLLKTAIFSKRKMNLVCVENVAEAIYFLTIYKGDISGHYIISDDDVKMNNYYDVVCLLCKHLSLPQVKIFSIPFQNFLLSVLLKLRRRSNTNPQRIYSSEKLLKLGYTKAVNLQDGIRTFAEWYSTSYLKDRRYKV